MTSFKADVQNDIDIALDPDEHLEYAWFALPNLLYEDNVLWGIPTVLHDFGLLPNLDEDPTLADGSKALLLELAN